METNKITLKYDPETVCQTTRVTRWFKMVDGKWERSNPPRHDSEGQYICATDEAAAGAVDPSQVKAKAF